MSSTDLALWQALAFETVRRLAATVDAFSTDSVCFTLDDLPKPSDNRALGPVLTRAQKEGVIRKTGMFVVSERRVCHGRPVAVWLSRLRNADDIAAASFVASKRKTMEAPQFTGSLLHLTSHEHGEINA